MLSLDHKNTA